MNKIFNLQNKAIIFAIPLLLIGMMYFITQSPIFSVNSNRLSIGITFDLLLVIPLVYFLLIRKTDIPNTTVVPCLIIGVVVCSFILPIKNQYYLNIFKTWILPIIELSVLSFVIFNVRKGIKRYKLNKIETVDFFTTLKETCYEILPKIAVIPMVTEISVFYYGFMSWKTRTLKNHEFSYHKDNGAIALLVATIFIVAIESFVMHLLVAKWSHTFAWVLTCLSIYSGIQIFGFLKSMFDRPISIENGKLFLRYGIMNETTIEITDIDSIEITSSDIELNNETRKLSFLGELESHNIIIRLKKENTLIGLYGIKRQYKNLALHIDNKTDFYNQITSLLDKNESI